MGVMWGVIWGREKLNLFSRMRSKPEILRRHHSRVLSRDTEARTKNQLRATNGFFPEKGNEDDPRGQLDMHNLACINNFD